MKWFLQRLAGVNLDMMAARSPRQLYHPRTSKYETIYRKITAGRQLIITTKKQGAIRVPWGTPAGTCI